MILKPIDFVSKLYAFLCIIERIFIFIRKFNKILMFSRKENYCVDFFYSFYFIWILFFEDSGMFVETNWRDKLFWRFYMQIDLTVNTDLTTDLAVEGFDNELNSRLK